VLLIPWSEVESHEDTKPDETDSGQLKIICFVPFVLSWLYIGSGVMHSPESIIAVAIT